MKTTIQSIKCLINKPCGIIQGEEKLNDEFEEVLDSIIEYKDENLHIYLQSAYVDLLSDYMCLDFNFTFYNTNFNKLETTYRKIIEKFIYDYIENINNTLKTHDIFGYLPNAYIIYEHNDIYVQLSHHQKELSLELKPVTVSIHPNENLDYFINDIIDDICDN